MGFSTPQAHIVVAGVCMVVCSVTTLHLARAHDDARASSLVLYAWSHWASHLALSGYTLANPNAVRLADAMLFGVSTDLLVFLLALNDFATGPITFSSSSSSSSSSSAVEDRLARVAEVQRLQKALEGPLLLLSSLVRRNGYADTLQGARDIFEASKNARTGTSTSSTSSNSADASKALESPLAVDGALLSQLPRVGSQVETLQVDKFLPASLPRFGEPERQLVRGFAELARGSWACTRRRGRPWTCSSTPPF
ncbi:hypothetical protein VTK73DRAFT_6025 [Phialemonium thermophilum]|uniref:DUF4220 domain-containing protein n=1 Tax=Phialemonium thermophilum TaxID=223376 RepID=A0ABR3V042_9PEZI